MRLFDDPAPEPVVGDLCSVEGLLRLLQLPGVGPQRALKLASRFGSWASLESASESELRDCLGAAGARLPAGMAAVEKPPALPQGVRAIGAYDDDWPAWLTHIPNPPAVVFVRGSLPVGESIAVVGTRSPTRFGARVVERVVEAVAERGGGVVSGLALGIDTMAHTAALRFGAPTWAILGGGVDVPTPRSNLDLADRIVESGGGLLSEQLPGAEPSPQRLASRNRLQTAAARAVVVAQCGIPSGTLHTARFALEQGRLLVVPRPRPPWDQEAESAGNMALTDPNGCDPAVLHAGGSLGELIRAKRPVADLVLTEAGEINKLWG